MNQLHRKTLLLAALTIFILTGRSIGAPDSPSKPLAAQAKANTAITPVFLPLIAQDLNITSTPVTRIDLPKGPTLIYTGKTNRMRIFWQWTGSTQFRLDWGKNQTYTTGSAIIQEYDSANHLYAFTIEGLEPGTLYFYRVVRNQDYASGSFLTAPAESASQLKFVSYGDTRTNPDLHDAVAGQILSLIKSDPKYQTFNLMVGDWVSDGNVEQYWKDELFDPRWKNIRSLLGSTAFLSAMGNHEGNGALFLRYFPLPYTAARYGSFDYGPAHIAIVDQYIDYSAGSAQIAWLKNDLATSKKLWKFVVLHEPGWSAGGHANNPQVQTVLQPILVEANVAILFTGHNHYYARALVEGVTHLTVGTGGAPLYPPLSGMPNIVATYYGTGYTRLEINGSSLNGEMVGADGLVKDAFSITR